MSRFLTKTDSSSPVSAGSRFVACDRNTTARPSADSAGLYTSLFAGTPVSDVLASSTMPVSRFLTYRFKRPTSPGTRLVAKEVKATTVPSPVRSAS